MEISTLVDATIYQIFPNLVDGLRRVMASSRSNDVENCEVLINSHFSPYSLPDTRIL